MSEDIETAPEAKNETSPRVWPALLIIALQFVATLLAIQLGSSTMEGAIGYTIAPLVGAILLGLWWLFGSRVGIRDRIVGVLLYAILAAVTMYSQTPPDYRILLVTFPVLSAVTVAAMVFTGTMRWPTRRIFVAVSMIGCAIAVSALRVDGVSGALAPQVSWRWNTPVEETLAASAEATPTHTGGTADLPPTLSKEDWPGFRGANRDGIVRGVTFAADWNATPPTERWRIPVGLGWSSFTVVGDYFFTQEQRGDAEVVACYELETGESVWLNQVAARFNDPMGSGPRGTPEYHEGKLYTQGATGIIMALDASTGETLWSRNVMDDTGAKLPTWGFSSSPLLAAGNVIVYTGGADNKGVIAYKASTGEIAWTSGSGSHGYSSGQLAVIDGVEQILMSSNYGTQALAPADGALLWEDAWDIKDMPRVVQPLVLEDGHVIAGTGQGKGARLLAIEQGEGGWTVEEKWTSKRFRPYFNDFIRFGDYCYGYDGNRIACINIETGERAWNGANLGGQVLLVEDMGALIILAENGDLILADADPGGYNERARIPALGSKTWNHPVIAYGKLLVRNDQEVICYELPAAE